MTDFNQGKKPNTTPSHSASVNKLEGKLAEIN